MRDGCGIRRYARLHWRVVHERSTHRGDCRHDRRQFENGGAFIGAVVVFVPPGVAPTRCRVPIKVEDFNEPLPDDPSARSLEDRGGAYGNGLTSVQRANDLLQAFDSRCHVWSLASIRSAAILSS